MNSLLHSTVYIRKAHGQLVRGKITRIGVSDPGFPERKNFIEVSLLVKNQRKTRGETEKGIENPKNFHREKIILSPKDPDLILNQHEKE